MIHFTARILLGSLLFVAVSAVPQSMVAFNAEYKCRALSEKIYKVNLAPSSNGISCSDEGMVRCVVDTPGDDLSTHIFQQDFILQCIRNSQI